VATGGVEDRSLVGARGLDPAVEERFGHLGLQAPVLAAGAERTTGIDHDVPDLARRVRRAGEQTAVEHEAGADALVHPHGDQVGGRAVAEGQLGERAGVGVVEHRDGQAEGLAQLAGEVHVGPAEVGGGGDHPGAVDDAGRGDADAQQLGVGGGDEVLADALHEGDRGLARLAGALVRAPLDDLAAEVHERPGELRR
jgi:hypothetical protein